MSVTAIKAFWFLNRSSTGSVRFIFTLNWPSGEIKSLYSSGILEICTGVGVPLSSYQGFISYATAANSVTCTPGSFALSPVVSVSKTTKAFPNPLRYSINSL